MKLSEDFSIRFADNNVYAFEVTGRTRDEHDSSQKNFADWTKTTVRVQDWEVIPHGENNDLSQEIQEPIFASNQGKRIQSRKVDLLWGDGPDLYTVDRSGDEPVRKYSDDHKNIREWLEGFDAFEQLYCLSDDYYYTEVLYQKIFTDRGARIGSSSQIAKTEYMSTSECRLCYKKSNKTKKATHVMVADWGASQQKEYEVYPLFNPLEPDKYPVSISYTRKKSFATPYYAIPDVYGALAWIRRANAIPFILEALTNNSLNIKWHITSPAKYWAGRRKILQEIAKKEGREYKEQELEDLKKQILDNISKILSGVDNIGKFWHNEKIVEILGATRVEHNWEIKPIEQKTKEFIEGQLAIAKHAGFAEAAGMGLHTSLAGIGSDGKSDSGSEQLYAYQGHLKTATRIPEFYVTKTLNLLIKIKFKKEVYIGFRQNMIERQEDQSPNDRFKNAPSI